MRATGGKSVAIFGAGLLAACATAPTVRPEAKEIAPAGKLRAAINFGNPVLAQKDEGSGEARGVSVDLARELGRRLGIPVELVPYQSAGNVFEAAQTGAWDVAFLAIDPARASEIAFTPPYVVIDGTYLVPAGSPIHSLEEVDREGVRVAVGRKSAYDLFLSRTLKRATIVRAETSPGAIDLFLRDKLEACAGVKQPLLRTAQANPGLRVLGGRFMAIEQAMGMPKGRDGGARYLRDFVEEMKRSGFVAKSLEKSGQRDAEIAPPSPAQ